MHKETFEIRIAPLPEEKCFGSFKMTGHNRAAIEQFCEARAQRRAERGEKVTRFGNWWGTSTGEFIAGYHELTAEQPHGAGQ